MIAEMDFLSIGVGLVGLFAGA